MHIIKDAPAKGWQIVRQTMPSGEYKYHTGYNSYYFLSNVEDGVHICWDYADRTNPQKIETPVEYVENFVFEARLRYTGCQRGRSAAIFCFEDADGLNTVETGMSGMDELLQGLLQGTTTIQDECFVGTWTFRKQGSVIYVHPLKEEVRP